MGERVVVLGASDDPARVAYRAQRLLAEHGHSVTGVNPRLRTADGTHCVAHLDAVSGTVDTITVYLRPELAEPLADAMIALHPKRVIFNPGSESTALSNKLATAGIRVQWECTLVLLHNGAYTR
jgi:predicted CoA-binding protein